MDPYFREDDGKNIQTYAILVHARIHSFGTLQFSQEQYFFLKIPCIFPKIVMIHFGRDSILPTVNTVYYVRKSAKLQL